MSARQRRLKRQHRTATAALPSGAQQLFLLVFFWHCFDQEFHQYGEDSISKEKKAARVTIYIQGAGSVHTLLSHRQSCVPGVALPATLQVDRHSVSPCLQGEFLYDPATWSTQRDEIGREGIRGEVKVVVCFRLLGYGRSLWYLDDSTHIGKDSIRKYFYLFSAHIKAIYGPSLLNRRPTKQ